MSIVLTGIGKEWVTADVFPVVASEPKGPGRVTFHIPQGREYDLHADEQERAWPEHVEVLQDRTDEAVEVHISVGEPNNFLLISYLNWGPQQEIVRVRAHEGITVLLDGHPGQRMTGYAIDRPGGPERDPSFRRLDNG